jgi:hypothetical protein
MIGTGIRCIVGRKPAVGGAAAACTGGNEQGEKRCESNRTHGLVPPLLRFGVQPMCPAWNKISAMVFQSFRVNNVRMSHQNFEIGK